MWAQDLRTAEAASASLSPEQLLVIQLEDLVLYEREKSFEQLVDFLELGNVEPMRSFFESEVTPERAHIGRSRVELGEEERDHVDALYEGLLNELREEGISCVPSQRQPSVTYSESTEAHPFDPWSGLSGAG